MTIKKYQAQSSRLNPENSLSQQPENSVWRLVNIHSMLSSILFLITVLKWNSCTVSIPIYLLLHLGHMLLPGNYENLFLQLKHTIYCIVVSWHHTLTRSLTAEERLSCSCYYWIGLSRCISFWQTKAFKIIAVVLATCWISKHWMSHNSCWLFSIYTQWQTDYCPPSAQVFLRKEEGKPRGCLCLQNNGRSSSSGLLYTPWNVICCASQEKSCHHIFPPSIVQDCIISYMLFDFYFSWWLSPGISNFLLQ